MAKTPRNEGDKADENAEKRIILLVKNVKDNGCEASFIKIRSYLDSYIKLFVKKYRIPGCDHDEIEQECLCALWHKAIEDFDPTRGKFKSFAVLCIKRHLFSLIKGSKQQKRLALNQGLSLEEERSDDENLSLSSLIVEEGPTADEQLENKELAKLQHDKFMSKLSDFEKEVFKLYIQKFKYEEIVLILKKTMKEKELKEKELNSRSIDNVVQRMRKKYKNKIEKIDKKSIDNALQRLHKKYKEMDSNNDFFKSDT